MSVDSRTELAIDHIEARDKRAGSNLYTLFMQAPAIICALRGPDHVFDLVNPLYRQLFGERELLGKPVREAIPELEGQCFFELLNTLVTAGARTGDTALCDNFYTPHLSDDGAYWLVAMVGEFLYRITDPVLRPIRNMMPNLGGIDISPIILFLIIILIQRVIIYYIYPYVF